MKRTTYLVVLGAGILGFILTALTPRSHVPTYAGASRESVAGLSLAAQRGPHESTPQGAPAARRTVEAPPWAIAYGKEFWRRPADTNPPKPTAALPAQVDIGDVMERVSHSFELTANSSAPVLRAQTYTARFTGEG